MKRKKKMKLEIEKKNEKKKEFVRKCDLMVLRAI